MSELTPPLDCGWIDRSHELRAPGSAWVLSSWKRAADVTVALAAFVALLPVYALLSTTIAITMGRPVLFRQSRPGLGGRPFVLLKFRSMTNDRAPDDSLLPDRERTSAVGRFLRKTSLDELPSLINVIRGDMSLVGPRPLRMAYMARYSREQLQRQAVRPGITGFAQAHGRNTVEWRERLALDVWYTDHATPGTDVTVLLKTVRSVLRREGIDLPADARPFGETRA